MRLQRRPLARQAPDGANHDEQAAADQDDRLTERTEILRPAVPVVMVGVSGASPEPDGQKRQDRRDNVAA